MSTRLLVAVAALAGLVACRSTYHDASFVPAPLEAQVLAEGEPLAQARALVRVRGILRERPREGLGAEVEVFLRLDNLGQTPLAFTDDGLDLVAADLVSFGAPRIEPQPGEVVAPEEQRTYRMCFPMPAGKDVRDVDWSGLNLKWKVLFDEREAVTGVNFERELPPIPWGPGYYDPIGPYAGPARSCLTVGFTVGGDLEN